MHCHREVVWCDREGNPTNWAGPLPSVDMVSGGLVFASPSMLRFLNPENFVAGNLSECLPHWEVILKDYPKAAEIFLRYVSQGINVQEFFVPFNGMYRGHPYNADIPPRKSFPNSFHIYG